MTLQEWCDKTGILATHPTTERGAVSVLAPRLRETDHSASWNLFHLTDFAVSSVSGPVYWLVPRVAAPGEITFEVPNLDCDWPDELRKFADVLEKLKDYAFFKANAMEHRAVGEISNALKHEDRCGRIYQQLPQWAKW